MADLFGRENDTSALEADASIPVPKRYSAAFAAAGVRRP
jgi:hypothetical protein